MQNDKQPPLLSTTAVRPASQRKHQPVPRTAALERVEPTNELTRQSRSRGCMFKKEMHKFTHLETCSPQELVTMTI